MTNTMTKEELIERLVKIRDMGWIENKRPGNAGGVGNTIEDLLGIEENNLPIPNAREWELKCQRSNTTSLLTLFHMEPSPRALRFVPQIFLPKYGWPHELAGRDYPKGEMSFRQTINCTHTSDRGFKVVVDREQNKVLVTFDSNGISQENASWYDSLRNRGVGELNPVPYWGFDDLHHKAATKLLNCFYILADSKKENKKEYFSYKTIRILKDFSFDNFLKTLENGHIFVDFDARTGHNHGTKFRIKADKIPDLYGTVQAV
ncbi:MAG: MvaI/BcnI family restriction endonuclease [Candidatus Micrarchaeota archaeon]|nr:MvaI/BcnI family restriction endonuclease [Candidatus Micrarchaeota archaeon]